MTPEQINDMEIAAQHCDDYSQFKREMREVARLRAKYSHSRTFPQTPQPKPERRAQLRTAADVERQRKAKITAAIDQMDRLLGYA